MRKLNVEVRLGVRPNMKGKDFWTLSEEERVRLIVNSLRGRTMRISDFEIMDYY